MQKSREKSICDNFVSNSALVASFTGTLRFQEKVHTTEGKDMGMLLKAPAGSFVLRLFKLSFVGGNPRKCLREGFSRMFIGFPSVSFNMLTYQNEQAHRGSGSFLGQL